MSKSSTRASYILTCLSLSDVHLSNLTSLVENLFSPSKVSSLVVVVVMVVGGDETLGTSAREITRAP